MRKYYKSSECHIAKQIRLISRHGASCPGACQRGEEDIKFAGAACQPERGVRARGT